MNHVEKMLYELSLHFRSQVPGEQATAAWAQSWVRAFKKHQPWELEAATQRLIEHRQERSFPIPADVHRAIKEIRDLERMNNPKMKVAPQEQHADPFALADALINCQLGRTAARDNPSWIVPLHDFCRENRRLPLSNEIAKIKKDAHDGEQIEYAIATGKLVDMLPLLRDFREKNKRRREKLRRRLLGAEADTSTPSTFVPDPDWMEKALAAHHAREDARDPTNAERYRLAREWRAKVTAEYGSVDRYLTIRRPPGNVAQNKGG